MPPKTLLISALAGIAAAVMVVYASRLGGIGVPLMLAASIPVYAVTFSFGTFSGMSASVVAILVTASLANLPMAIVAGLLHTIPASMIGHQANLGQPDGKGGMVWYPLSRLFFNLSIALALGIIAIGFVTGYSAENAMPVMKEALAEVLRLNPQQPQLSDTELDELANRMFRLLAFFFSGMWLAVHVLNAHLAAQLSRSFGAMPRPKDDIPATTSLPKISLAIFMVTLVLTVILDGPLQHIAAVFSGMFMMALALAGLAAFHMKLRGNSAAFVVLFATYALIVLFYFPLLLFAIGGIRRIFSNNSNDSNNLPERRNQQD